MSRIANRTEALPPRRRSAGSVQFLYDEVAEALRHRIKTKTYRQGLQIPTIAELAAEFGVSTVTVRQAVKTLTLEGRLVSKQGLGVFVAHGGRIVRSLAIDRIMPIEHELQVSSVLPSLLDRGAHSARTSDRPFLTGLGRRDAVITLFDRLLLADGEPVGRDRLWMRRSLAARLGEGASGRFVMSMLEPNGYPINRISYEIEATTASKTLASDLGAVEGFPLLVVRYFPHDLENRLLLVGETITRADRFTYRFGAAMAEGGPKS